MTTLRVLVALESDVASTVADAAPHIRPPPLPAANRSPSPSSSSSSPSSPASPSAPLNLLGLGSSAFKKGSAEETAGGGAMGDVDVLDPTAVLAQFPDHSPAKLAALVQLHAAMVLAHRECRAPPRTGNHVIAVSAMPAGSLDGLTQSAPIGGGWFDLAVVDRADGPDGHKASALASAVVGLEGGRAGAGGGLLGGLPSLASRSRRLADAINKWAVGEVRRRQDAVGAVADELGRLLPEAEAMKDKGAWVRGGEREHREGVGAVAGDRSALAMAKELLLAQDPEEMARRKREAEAREAQALADLERAHQQRVADEERQQQLQRAEREAREREEERRRREERERREEEMRAAKEQADAEARQRDAKAFAATKLQTLFRARTARTRHHHALAATRTLQASARRLLALRLSHALAAKRVVVQGVCRVAVARHARAARAQAVTTLQGRARTWACVRDLRRHVGAATVIQARARVGLAKGRAVVQGKRMAEMAVKHKSGFKMQAPGAGQ